MSDKRNGISVGSRWKLKDKEETRRYKCVDCGSRTYEVRYIEPVDILFNCVACGRAYQCSEGLFLSIMRSKDVVREKYRMIDMGSHWVTEKVK